VTATHADTVLPALVTRLEPRELRAGDRGGLIVTLDIPPDVHIQSHDPTEPFLIPTTLRLDPIPDVTFGPVDYPTPHPVRFDWTPVQLDVYRGTIEIVVPLTIAHRRAGDAITITGHLRYQACTERSCHPPAQHPLEAALDIEPQTVRDATHRAPLDRTD
jgi:thioredoxin:protein disulfide reductase